MLSNNPISKRFRIKVRRNNKQNTYTPTPIAWRWNSHSGLRKVLVQGTMDHPLPFVGVVWIYGRPGKAPTSHDKPGS